MSNRHEIQYDLEEGIMNNNWLGIWSKKTVNDVEMLPEFEKYSELKRANGFDVSVDNEEKYYKSFYDQWISFYEMVNDLSGGIESAYEVGCGSGVNLFMFANRGIKILGGIDYSKSLVENSKKVVMSDDIRKGEAADLSVEPRYDLVFAESVFQYFNDHCYAETVLRKMIEKSTRLTYLGEVHDAEYETELLNYRRSRIADYDEKYKGLSKLFYDREWIEKTADDYGRRVIYSKVNNPQYINSKYLFNCYIV